MDRCFTFIAPLLLIPCISSCGPAKMPDAVVDVQDATKNPEARIEEKMPAAKTKPPDRPPELFGIVERVERRSILPDYKEFEAVLIKGHPPPVGKLKPSSPLYSNGQPDLMWLNMPRTTVERRNGPIVVGQYVWVWYDGEVFKTEPGQIYPEYVISEAAMQK